MALRFINDNGLFRLFDDNTAELIELSPRLLTDLRGVFVLGGNDTVIGSTISELILGNDGQDSISGGAGGVTTRLKPIFSKD